MISRRRSKDPAGIPVGVVGMGLMGTSIATCLLAAGHPVAAVESDPARRRTAPRRVLAHLKEMQREGLLKQDPSRVARRLSVSGDYALLQDSLMVIESIVESIQAKKRVIRRLEEAVSPRTLIGSNTSAIPLTRLQEGALHPDRILGVHWAEPAHVTRFLELICGQKTSLACVKRAADLARPWGKEPTIVRRDIRGFIANRIMYAMIREAFFLVESGYATVADVDRSLRNDLGYWITLAGPFRYMDLTGIPAYATVMRDLLPELSRQTRVPKLMRKVVQSGAQGVSNAKGFYRYTRAQAAKWRKLHLQFTYDIRALALKYAKSG